MSEPSCSSALITSRSLDEPLAVVAVARGGRSCSSAARPASARRRSCGASATSTAGRCGCSGAHATRCSRRVRSDRSSTSPRSRAASSRRSSSAAPAARDRGGAHARAAARAPTILVLEDLHWADEATLDVLKLLARRIETIPALVLASYRDDELDRAHPLRIVLGELATRPGGRAAEARAAVAGRGRAARRAARRRRRRALPQDRRQPVLRHRGARRGRREIPDTVRDAVLARAARLSPAARTLLEAVAVVPPPVELWLLEALAPEASTVSTSA